ncbi:MAG TPA: autotransporter-associated beta strand repeat-containing protein, partial [Candidatus Anammoximicrobium sp.]|nr:autotransporter-associated beta strand repeat-containing protein [Candidatus Anammoximicrobium sp.]
PSDYNASNAISIPNASGSTYDFGDGGSNGTAQGYGSFQVHNHDLDGAGPGTAGQTLFAYNTWRGGGDLGIGNKPSGNPDWTFSNNYASYAWRRLVVLVRETAADTSVRKEGSGTLTLSGDNSHDGATMIEDGTLIAASDNALGFPGAGTTVQDGATLALQGGITISGEPLTLNGLGAAGQLGVLVNLSGANTIADTSPITAELVSLGQVGIGSVAGTLTIDADIDLQFSGLIVAGPGDVVVNGVISGIGITIDTSLPHHTNTQVFNNVAEADDYVVAYELPIPATNVSFRDTNPVPYSIDDTALINPFDRIAYYLELDTGTGLRWVYASMNAFTSNIGQIGLPHNVNNPVKFQQIVSNMNVFSNVAGIVTGTGIATGNIEFWPSNYGQANDIGIPGASGSAFDFGDGSASTAAGHGSFQVHNYGAAQTLFGFSDWGGNNATGNVELGIGTNSGTVQTPGGPVSVGGSPDWTFADAGHLYTVKNLVVLVHEATPRPVLYPDNSLHKTGSGTLTLAGANAYNGPTTIDEGKLWVYGSLADGPAADDVVVNAGGTIGGTGTSYGQVRVNTGGTAAPGDTPGVITSDTLILTGGSTFEVELEGTTPGNGAGYHDQWTISDSVNLGGATLSVLLGTTFTPPAGSAYVIVRNDSANPVAGTFDGIANGGTISVTGGTGTYNFLVFYTGGDGNDVVLVEATAPTAVYVDDATNFNLGHAPAPGEFIPDADFGSGGNQP